jgi:hypothetical protein
MRGLYRAKFQKLEFFFDFLDILDVLAFLIDGWQTNFQCATCEAFKQIYTSYTRQG